MLPNNLVSGIFSCFHDGATTPPGGKNHDILTTLEQSVPGANHYAGQAKNTLLEESNRHLKDRLFCAVKIEAMATVLNELIEQEKINPADLQMLIEDKTMLITEKAPQIWVNQLTQEKHWPLFYSLEM